ncbi:MAG: LamG domain-containing protein, partial [Acidobacteriota bacterium]
MFPNRAPGTAVHNRPPARAGLLDHRAAATIVALCCILVFAPSTAAQDEGRVTAGLAALYTFSEGSGDLVADTSGAFATPLDLTLTTPGTATWLDGGGLALEAPTTLISNGVALDPALAVQASGELTVEAWLRTADLDQSGPARIVSLSDGNHDRNFALGQGRWGWQPTDTFDFRLRTTATDDNGRPSSTTPAGTVLPEIQHVVVTRRSDGTVEAYVGGESVFTGQVAGDLSNWDVGYVLALGDEVGGGRPWLGELHLVALYSRALSGAEVAQNFAAGPGSRPARITDGQRALYTFLEGSGGQVADVSGVGSALDLNVADPAAVTWLDGGGIALESPTVLESAGAADKISDAVALSGALTLEAWLAPTDLTLGGPARIVSLSDGWHDRNLTLGQGDGAGGTDFYDLRLRSTATNANGYPSTAAPTGSLETGLQHVVATRSADGWIRLYVDDRLVTSRRMTGSLAGWDSAYPLLLGNETTGDRPWLGELHLVAIYDRALDSGEITQNYYAGPPTAGGG